MPKSFTRNLDTARNKWHRKFLLDGESRGEETVKSVAGIVEKAVFGSRSNGHHFNELEGPSGERILTFPSVKISHFAGRMLPFSVAISRHITDQHAMELLRAMFMTKPSGISLRNREFYCRSEYGMVNARGKNNALVFFNRIGTDGVDRLIATNLLYGDPASRPYVHRADVAMTNCYSSENLRIVPYRGAVDPIYRILKDTRQKLVSARIWKTNLVIDDINEDNFTRVNGSPVNFDPVYNKEGYYLLFPTDNF